MCRLLGFYNCGEPEDVPAGFAAATMFVALTHGGPHAWGWMAHTVPAVPEDDGIDYFKSPGRADTDNAITTMLTDIPENPEWFVGHVRYATNGSPLDNRNNHPIMHGDIMGVHNGVLSRWQEIIDKTGREDPKAEVDSEAIFAAVNKWGNLPGLRQVKGSAVTIYANLDRPSILHFAKTQGRDLHFGWSDRGNVYWASEKQALEALAPDIRIVRYSVLSMNRHLVMKGGRFIRRESIHAGIKTTSSSASYMLDQIAAIGTTRKRDYYEDFLWDDDWEPSKPYAVLPEPIGKPVGAPKSKSKPIGPIGRPPAPLPSVLVQHKIR